MLLEHECVHLIPNAPFTRERTLILLSRSFEEECERYICLLGKRAGDELAMIEPSSESGLLR